MRVAVAPLVLALLLVPGCADDGAPDRVAAPSPSGTPALPAGNRSPGATVPTGVPSAAPVPSAEPAARAPATTVRAVYWLGALQQPRGPRLYREFVRRPADADPVHDALEVMLGSAPRDPDYTSLWAEGTRVRDVRLEGRTAVVDLSGEARRHGAGSSFESATIQQLVHTVTAADPGVRDVRVLVEGQPVDSLWGHVDLSRPVAREPAAQVLGPVWVDLPEGAEVAGTFGGTASVFEATVSWELRQGDRVVQKGFSTATEGAPGRGEWEGDADVPPGDYVLWAYESSAEDGSVMWPDTKSVTVTP